VTSAEEVARETATRLTDRNRNKAKHVERNDQLFIMKMMLADK